MTKLLFQGLLQDEALFLLNVAPLFFVRRPNVSVEAELTYFVLLFASYFFVVLCFVVNTKILG